MKLLKSNILKFIIAAAIICIPASGFAQSYSVQCNTPGSTTASQTTTGCTRYKVTYVNGKTVITPVTANNTTSVPTSKPSATPAPAKTPQTTGTVPSANTQNTAGYTRYRITYVNGKMIITPVTNNNTPSTPTPAPTPKPAPTPAPTPQSTGTLPTGNMITPSKQQLLDLINNERSKAGVKPLSFDDTLNRVAQLKSDDMKANNYFSHNSPTYGTPFQMMQKFGVSFKSAGENIATNYSVADAHTAFMNSPGHRANILNSSYTNIGIGITNNSGSLIIVEQFIEK